MSKTIRRKIEGVWTAIVTPFKSDGSIDFPAYTNLLSDQVKAGVHGIIPCGTTGESPTLSLDEKKELLAVTLETLDGFSKFLLKSITRSCVLSIFVYSPLFQATGP